MEARPFGMFSFEAVLFILYFTKEKGCKSVSFVDYDYWDLDLNLEEIKVLEEGEFERMDVRLFCHWKVISYYEERTLVVG